MTRYRIVRLFLVGLILVGLLAACGATATNTAAPTAAPAAPTAAATATATAGAAPATTTVAPLATTLAATPTVAASGGSGAATPTPGAVPPTVTPVSVGTPQTGAIKLTLWYGLGGTLGNEMLKVVSKFNQSQTKYFIEPVFQSSYEDTINKLNAGLAGGNLPNIAQIYDGGNQRMIDSKRIIPVQDFIERDKQQAILDDMEVAMRGRYSLNGRLYSMPFNSSTAVLYIDRKAFREVGLDPDKKFWTYEEILDAAKKLTKKDASGKITRAGIATWPEPWHIEQILGLQNGLYADPGNGSQGQRATKYVFNNDISVKFLEFMKKLVDDGSGIYFGANGRSAANTAYVNGEVAMHYDSIASLTSYIDSVARAGSKVEVGVIGMPRANNSQGRGYVGGAALSIIDQGTKEQQEGAWEFLKFTVRPEIQAVFSSSTGYLATMRSAYDRPEMKEALAKYPQLTVAIDQLRGGSNASASSDIFVGTFVSARDDVKAAMDAYLSGKNPSAKAALDDAAKKANEKLDEYVSALK